MGDEGAVMGIRAIDEVDKAELAATLRKWAEEIESFDGVVTCQDATVRHDYPIPYVVQEGRSGRVAYTMEVTYLPRGSLGTTE